MDELINVKFDQLISIHPNATDLVKTFFDAVYTTNSNDISEGALARLLLMYPIAVVPKGRSKNAYYVIGGFRQFELLRVFHARARLSNSKLETNLCDIQVILKRVKADSISQVSHDDLIGSALIFSLGTKVSQQLERIKTVVAQNYLDDYPIFNQYRHVSLNTKKSED